MGEGEGESEGDWRGRLGLDLPRWAKEVKFAFFNPALASSHRHTPGPGTDLRRGDLGGPYMQALPVCQVLIPPGLGQWGLKGGRGRSAAPPSEQGGLHPRGIRDPEAANTHIVSGEGSEAAGPPGCPKRSVTPFSVFPWAPPAQPAAGAPAGSMPARLQREHSAKPRLTQVPRSPFVLISSLRH